MTRVWSKCLRPILLDEADEEVRREWANHFTHGILDFRREWDKENFHWPVPVCTALRKEIDDYLARRKLTQGPLFPSEGNPQKPLCQSTVSKSPWTDPKTGRMKIGRFDRAWQLARMYLSDAGLNPDDLMPIRKGYKIHRVRGFVATQFAELGFGKTHLGGDDGHDFDDHANYIGGWALNNNIKSEHYIPLDPAVLMDLVEWKKAHHVLNDRAELAHARAAHAQERLTAGLRARRGPEMLRQAS